MSTSTVPQFSAADYERAALEYMASLPLEHYMERELAAVQRRIVMDVFPALQARGCAVHLFNELAVTFQSEGRLQTICPDNSVVLANLPDMDRTTFSFELEPNPLFMVIEYVSPRPRDERKDYEESFAIYEQELHVPYCVMFHPEKRDLRIFRHNRDEYVRLEPDSRGRIAIPEMEMEVGILDGWMRFWHRGELIPLRPEVEAEVAGLKSEIVGLKTELGDIKSRETQRLDRLRNRVEQRATARGRTDLLPQLKTATEEQLEFWHDELFQ